MPVPEQRTYTAAAWPFAACDTSLAAAGRKPLLAGPHVWVGRGDRWAGWRGGGLHYPTVGQCVPTGRGVPLTGSGPAAGWRRCGRVSCQRRVSCHPRPPPGQSDTRPPAASTRRRQVTFLISKRASRGRLGDHTEETHWSTTCRRQGQQVAWSELLSFAATQRANKRLTTDSRNRCDATL